MPNFAAGLRKHERCLWVTAEPFPLAAARAALRAEVPDLDARERAGQIEILPSCDEQWRDAGGANAAALVEQWLSREAAALRAGYAGLRVSVNTPRLEPQRWADLADCEAHAHQIVQGRRIIALCSYCLGPCGHRELVDVMHNHRFALVRRGGRWDALRSSTAALALLQGVPQPQLDGHSVEFFREGAFPAARIAATLRGALDFGMAAGAFARRGHLEALRRALADGGVDVEDRCAASQLVLLDAESVFEAAWARPGLRVDALEERVLPAVSRAITQFGRIQMYGELVDLFAAVNDLDGAVALERWCNQVVARHPIELHCGYTLESFAGEIDGFHTVCDQHSAVRTADAGAPVQERLSAEVVLLKAALAREVQRWSEVQPAQEHLMVLQRVMTRLGEVLTLAELSAVVADEVQRTFAAQRVALLVEDDDGWRDLVTGELSALVPPDGTRPIWLDSAGALARAQPRLRALSPHAVTLLPLVVRGRRIGVLALGFPAEHTTNAWEQAVANDIALQVAHALDRTLLYDAADRASRAKDEFFAMLGHELRNPLSPILTATQLMRLRDESHCAKERTIIERQAKGLVRLVDDLLDVARITRGKLGIERRPVDLAIVIAAAVEQMGPVLEEGGHRVEVDVPPGTILAVDAARMIQVFSNLLGNAAKYSPRGGRIEVASAPAGDGVRICVRDHGAGIEPELLPHVFDVFVQGQQRSDRAHGGLGLGLSIARTIVNMHGGTIRAESDGPGRGSAFVVELPYPRGEAGDAQAGAQAPAADEAARLGESRPKRLLLVDDNEDGASLLALWLARRGHDVRVAYDPRSALAIAREFRPDVAILDIGLPEMDGYQLAAALREQRPEAAIRMIALTGYGQPSDRSRSAEAGFAVHLVKPVDLGAFQAAIVGRPESTAA